MSSATFAGNASGLFNIIAANIVGPIAANTATVANTANVSLSVANSAQPNITSVGTLTSLVVSGDTTSGNFIGNLSGTASSATVANTVSVAAQPNITSVGTLTSANINGLVNVTGLGGIFTSGGVTNPTGNGVSAGTVGNNPVIVLSSQQASANNKIWDTYVDGTGVYYGRIKNDTGTVSNNWLRVTRDSMTVNTISLLSNTAVTGTLSATSLAGDGGNITNIAAGNISAINSIANIPHYFLFGNAAPGSQPVKYAANFYFNPSNNYLYMGGNANVTGNITIGGSISAANLSGDGSGITNLTISNVNTVLASSGSNHYLFAGNVAGGSQSIQYVSNVYVNPSLNTMYVNGNLNSSNLTSTNLTSGNLTSNNIVVNDTLTLSNGFTMTGGATESFVPVTGTSTTALNLTSSGVFNVTLSQNSTAAFSSINTNNNFITGITVFVTQGTTGYTFSSATVNGGGTLTIKWAGGTVPTPSTSATDVFTFSIAKVGGVYTVYGQSIKFA